MAAQLQTFGKVRTSRILQIAGVCSTSNEFKQLVNDATEILMNRGDWPGLILPMQFCVRSNGCLVVPRFAGSIRKLNRCRNQHVFSDNYWWNFVDGGLYRDWCGMPYNQQRELTFMGGSPVYQDIPADGQWLIRAYPTKQADVGKTITIFGTDGNGQTLRHKEPTTNTWFDGTVIRMQVPFGTTRPSGPPNYVRHIDRVLKEVTQGDVALYAYRPSDGTQIQLAQYAPSEENPQYSKYQLRGGCSTGTCGTNGVFSVLALVKLQFIPVETDNDVVLIPSMMALKYAIQSIKYAEANEEDKSAKYMALAVRELAHVLDNEMPPEDMPIDPSFRGAECVGFQNIF